MKSCHYAGNKEHPRVRNPVLTMQPLSAVYSYHTLNHYAGRALISKDVGLLENENPKKKIFFLLPCLLPL